MININFRDSRPIYEQVKTTLRKLIVSGAMSPDEKLPSVRELASQLVINPNTIQRAYRELEQEGYIISIPGKGSYANLSAQVDEVYLSRVKVGDTLTFTLDAYADREYTGQVTEILPLGVEMQNATYYEVRLTISNAQDLLPGMSGTLYIS